MPTTTRSATMAADRGAEASRGERGAGRGAFLLGVAIVIWSTETLLEGMVGLVAVLRAAPLVIAGLFSGLAAENIAVGVGMAIAAS